MDQKKTDEPAEREAVSLLLDFIAIRIQPQERLLNTELLSHCNGIMDFIEI